MMKRLSLFSSPRLPILGIAIVCGTLAITGIGGVALRGSASSAPQNENKKVLQIQLRNGLGNEVKMAKDKNSPGQIKQSVESVAKFIEDRSGLIVSKRLKDRLVDLEQQTLTQQRRRVSADELVEIVTGVAIDRLSSLSNEDIDQSASNLDEQGEITLRANGKGSIKTSEFGDKAKEMRELSRQGDANFKELVHAKIQEEVTGRLDIYSESLPEHFGRAKRIGLTPLQGMLIAYSVASDDLMGNSQSTLKATQELIYEKAHGQGYRRGRKPNKAYGSEGYLFATPLNLVLNEATMNKLLDRITEKGEM